MASDPFKNLIVRRKSGESLYQEGDLGSEMYVVQSGEVRLFRLHDGQKEELAIMEKGDFFGELAVLEGLPRTSAAEAVGDIELIEINSATFDRMIRANIEIAVRMLRKLSNRLQEATRKLESLSHAPGAMPAESNVSAGVDMDRVAEPPIPTDGAIAAPTATGSAGVEVAVPNGALGLLVLEGGGRAFPVTSGAAVIGRYDPVTGSRPEIDLTHVDINRSVSRRHARLLLQDGSFFLTEEVGALNGTMVNGRKLVPGQPQALASGDRIALGMVALVFKSAPAAAPGPDRGHN
jgi:CRP-like cAMP-binding protein